MKKLILITALASALAACSSGTEAPAAPPPPPPPPAAAPPPPPPPPPPAAADPKAEADTIFGTRCATCHGANGMGDGPAATALNPKPRSYSDAEWQKSTTDENIAKVIVEGGPSIGKSPLMAANADLKDKPEVVKALVAKIRSYGPK